MKKKENNNKKDKSAQCNTMKTVISDLKKEIDFLLAQKENVICNDDDDDDIVHIRKNIDFRDDSKGKPYNFKLRNLYYIFRRRNIGLVHIAPIIQSVLELFDIHVENLPSKSTAAVLTSEMGVVSRFHLNEELTNSSNITMHRDATTKKGKHFYGVQFNTGEKVLTAGVREVCDGKGETYVDVTKDILSDISEKDGESVKILNNVSCFMTDRCATEQKVNDILTKEIDHDVHSFKCSIHPLLQFADVCIEEIFKIEQELGIKFPGYSHSSKDPFVWNAVTVLCGQLDCDHGHL